MKEIFSIVLSGAAGQGVQTVENLFTNIAKNSGYYVFATKEYMSRVRGGNNSTEIVISSKPVRAFRRKIDLLVVLNSNAIERLRDRIDDETIIIGEEKFIKGEKNAIFVPLIDISKEFGSIIYANSVAAGILSGIINADMEVVKNTVKQYFSEKGENVIQSNLNSILKGFEIGKDLNINFEIEKNNDVKKHILFNGSKAVANGAVAGGCNFISSYPMSPATAVFTELAKMSKDKKIIVDQAEDEIAAANMVIGAWYAGARALVSTSGGGFALMEEAISLSGMIETPIVVHLGQRPGPATGLPTRTEQGDLNLVLYAGHGTFPRIILAPSTLEEAFYLSAQAFNFADKFQVPVFILTDQYFLDTYYNVEKLPSVEVHRYIVETTKDYKRYELTENGISPRGIPGYGEGVVRVDSDEHDEYGHITESPKVRVDMVNKRMKKLNEILKDFISPVLCGNKDYEYLFVSWGSTSQILKEAIEELNNEKIAMLHFPQVYPLARKVEDYLKKAKKVIFVEQNATGQFADLVRMEFGIDTSNRILKYDGFPFSVEELKEKIGEAL
ncbi:2-oxoacid ferredoxin oxidoreductase, subunit alpha [Thermosipho africanus H17ap60334]|uniref:2-oxoacid:acceptor oxidoreductase subunit alpha n=1 Tax=Thermosipho africanus TaxID=2421 RepID=UPI00028E86D0|nr:2-oxoacid:acceptor oxidoreductase subunit alpha [Thermosipho africanus]EKF49104.1 2-oxoacid ferredoxin oxidoreductase, subunit alpha [Thermosipho africanus H17ap60334]